MHAPNIVWTRIDERLLHGQIRITWGKHTEANLILVANDDAAEGPNSAFMQAGMKASAGGEYAVRFSLSKKLSMSFTKRLPRQKSLFFAITQQMLLALSKVEFLSLTAMSAICISMKESAKLPKQCLWMSAT